MLDWEIPSARFNLCRLGRPVQLTLFTVEREPRLKVESEFKLLSKKVPEMEVNESDVMPVSPDALPAIRLPVIFRTPLSAIVPVTPLPIVISPLKVPQNDNKLAIHGDEIVIGPLHGVH